MIIEIMLGEVVICVLGVYGFYSLNKMVLTNKMLNESAKLKGQMAKFRQDYGNIEQNPSDFVAGSLGDIGIEGLMKQFGIDPKILGNPLVRGLIDKYAPDILSKMSKASQTNKTAETLTKANFL